MVYKIPCFLRKGLIRAKIIIILYFLHFLYKQIDIFQLFRNFVPL